jgi:NADPH-dependent 7-cyano-7-deazaguanine reductase QueF
VIGTIPNDHPGIHTRVRIVTPYSGGCPESGEPQAGSTIAVEYTPGTKLIELHAVQEYLKRFSEGDTPIDLETVAQETARDCAAALQVPVKAEARYLLRDGIEMVVTCRSS